MTPEEEKAVNERVHQAFIAGQFVMKQKILDMQKRQEQWNVRDPSRTVVSVAPAQALDDDSRASLIEWLKNGGEL